MLCRYNRFPLLGFELCYCCWTAGRGRRSARGLALAELTTNLSYRDKYKYEYNKPRSIVRRVWFVRSLVWVITIAVQSYAALVTRDEGV